MGTVAFLEQDVFLLLSYVPNSVLLADGDAFFFGFLDLHHNLGGAQRRGVGSWRWQAHLFVLKSGPGESRKLLWCRHPSDTKCVGSIQVDKLREVLPLGTPQDDGACLIIDYE